MRRRTLTALVAGVSIFAAVGCEDDGETLTIEVVSAAKGTNVSTGDIGQPGTTPGDVYVFDGPLLDSDEEETLGRVYGTQTSIARKPDAEVVQAMITYDLGDGNRITIGGISEYPLDEKALKENQPFERPIIGGTGEYAGADGTVTSVRRPDGAYEQTFHIEL